MTIMGHYPDNFTGFDDGADVPCDCQALVLELVEDWDEEPFTYYESREIETETGIWHHSRSECVFETRD